jgi:hypothetical protein
VPRENRLQSVDRAAIARGDLPQAPDVASHDRTIVTTAFCMCVAKLSSIVWQNDFSVHEPTKGHTRVLPAVPSRNAFHAVRKHAFVLSRSLRKRLPLAPRRVLHRHISAIAARAFRNESMTLEFRTPPLRVINPPAPRP